MKNYKVNLMIFVLIGLLSFVPAQESFACGKGKIGFEFKEDYPGDAERFRQLVARLYGKPLEKVNGVYCFPISATPFKITPGSPLPSSVAFEETARIHLSFNWPCKRNNAGLVVVRDLPLGAFDEFLKDDYNKNPESTFTNKVDIEHLEAIEAKNPVFATILVIHIMTEAAMLKHAYIIGPYGSPASWANPAGLPLNHLDAGAHYNAFYATAQYFELFKGEKQLPVAVTCLVSGAEVLYIFRTSTFSAVFEPRVKNSPHLRVARVSEFATVAPPALGTPCDAYLPRANRDAKAGGRSRTRGKSDLGNKSPNQKLRRQ